MFGLTCPVVCEQPLRALLSGKQSQRDLMSRSHLSRTVKDNDERIQAVRRHLLRGKESVPDIDTVASAERMRGKRIDRDFPYSPDCVGTGDAVIVVHRPDKKIGAVGSGGEKAQRSSEKQGEEHWLLYEFLVLNP
jgi:hypothetical protein